MKEPKRPAQVPKEAKWNGDEKEWELGVKKKEKLIGNWKWWLAPKGYLVCETNFDDKGNILNYSRFHADGTFSQKGKVTYENGKRVFSFVEYQRSKEKTTEYFGADVHPSIWKMEITDQKGKRTVNYFLEDGTKVDQDYKGKRKEKTYKFDPEILKKELENHIHEIEYEVITDEKELKKYKSKLKIHDLECPVRLYKGNVKFEGSIVLDTVEEYGIIVDGDLEVTEHLVQGEMDFGPFLAVLGNLKAKSVYSAGSEIFIEKNLIVSETVISYYNHGTQHVLGNLKAKFLIADDHEVVVSGKIDAVTINIGGTLKSADYDYHKNLEKFNTLENIFVDYVIDSPLNPTSDDPIDFDVNLLQDLVEKNLPYLK